MGGFVFNLRDVIREVPPLRRKRIEYRLLWSVICVAHREHYCNNCETDILPGEEYRREVWAHGRRLQVVRKHYPLECYPPEDPLEEKYLLEGDEVRKMDAENKVSLENAA